MEAEKKLEHLEFLSKTHRTEFHERRKYEWKITLTTLSFYALAITSTIDSTNRALFTNHAQSIWWIFLLLATITAVFLWRIHSANHKNLSYAENAENDIVGLLNCKKNDEMNIIHLTRSYWKSLRCIMFIMQAAIIFIFAVAAALFITTKQ